MSVFCCFLNCCNVLRFFLPICYFCMLNHNVFLCLLYYFRRVPLIPGIPFFFLKIIWGFYLSSIPSKDLFIRENIIFSLFSFFHLYLFEANHHWLSVQAVLCLSNCTLLWGGENGHCMVAMGRSTWPHESESNRLPYLGWVLGWVGLGSYLGAVDYTLLFKHSPCPWYH